jgi:hypothetical protein
LAGPSGAEGPPVGAGGSDIVDAGRAKTDFIREAEEVLTAIQRLRTEYAEAHGVYDDSVWEEAAGWPVTAADRLQTLLELVHACEASAAAVGRIWAQMAVGRDEAEAGSRSHCHTRATSEGAAGAGPTHARLAVSTIASTHARATTEVSGLAALHDRIVSQQAPLHDGRAAPPDVPAALAADYLAHVEDQPSDVAGMGPLAHLAGCAAVMGPLAPHVRALVRHYWAQRVGVVDAAAPALGAHLEQRCRHVYESGSRFDALFGVRQLRAFAMRLLRAQAGLDSTRALLARAGGDAISMTAALGAAAATAPLAGDVQAVAQPVGPQHDGDGGAEEYSGEFAGGPRGLTPLAPARLLPQACLPLAEGLTGVDSLEDVIRLHREVGYASGPAAALLGADVAAAAADLATNPASRPAGSPLPVAGHGLTHEPPEGLDRLLRAIRDSPPEVAIAALRQYVAGQPASAAAAAVNAISPAGATALRTAASTGAVDVVAALLAAGADPLLVHADGTTFFHAAAARGGAAALAMLRDGMAAVAPAGAGPAELRRLHAAVNTPSRAGSTCVHIVARNTMSSAAAAAAAVRLLVVEAGADPLQPDGRGRNALQLLATTHVHADVHGRTDAASGAGAEEGERAPVPAASAGAELMSDHYYREGGPEAGGGTASASATTARGAGTGMWSPCARYLFSAALADVTLLVPEAGPVADRGACSASPPLRRVPAHRVVLAGASDFFRALFDGAGSGRWAEASDGEVTLPDLPFPMVARLLRYAYTGEVTADVMARGDAVGAAAVLASACRYGMPQLAAEAETALVRDTTVDTAASVLGVALQHLPATRRLAHATAYFILSHFGAVAVAAARPSSDGDIRASDAGASSSALLARVLDYLVADGGSG